MLFLQPPDDGSFSIPVPEKLRSLVPKSFPMEAVQHPTGERQYCIIKVSQGKLKHVGLLLTEEELALPAKELREKYLRPAWEMLRRCW